MQFERDPKKAATNLRDHKVSFDEAATALEDEMRKADIAADELRSEYRREDFGPMVRGKYAARLRESSNIVVLDPEIAEAFPNAQAVNAALRSLLELAKTSVRLPVQSPQTPAQIGA